VARHAIALARHAPRGAARYDARISTTEGIPMDLRLAVYELSARHHLPARQRKRLAQLAGLHDEPAALAPWLPRGTAILGAALVGLGLIFWVAANWESLGRFGRFALLQSVVAVMCAGALWRPAARAPLGLLALLAIGGLFAYFGQTYQTGADPWQLFALWTVLSLPLALAIRSDVVWTPWAVVAMSAVSLWVHAHTGHRWRVEPQDLPVHLTGGMAALLVVAALGGIGRRVTGSGPSALRTALTLWVMSVTVAAIAALFRSSIAPHYWAAIVLFVAAAALLASPRFGDVFGLSAVGFGLDTVLVGGVAWALLHDHHGGEPIGPLFVIGLVAAALLAATVSIVLRVSRRIDAVGEQA